MSLFAITANRLNDGVVIFLTADGWSESLTDAEIAEGNDAMAGLLARAEAEPHIAVGPYEIAVERTETGIRPTKYREVIRTTGPSIDYLKPQAA
ncbi:MAG: DUF2849 domain-containing protein [Minwuia sp.]|uniref:DUF2849 domain-containing protein n=1 Tax=Minwuia sp. TaxID=2493630 RepID=UPI003A849ED0